MVIAGILASAIAVTMALNEAWLLAGLLLAFAGAVKLIIVALWRGIAAFDDAPRSGPPTAE